MMALVDQEIQLIELVTHVAQQVQRGKDASVHLAYLNRIFQEKKPETALLNALITSLDVPQLRRFLRRGRPDGTSATPPIIPGKRVTLYKATLPGETQARIATDSLIARYLSWLARNPHRRAVALTETNRCVILFIPNGSTFDPTEAWQEFVTFVFSGEELLRTFVAMLNSIQLSKRGFGVPDFPIVSEDQLLIILTWLFRSIHWLEEYPKKLRMRVQEWENRITYLNRVDNCSHSNVKKEIQTLRRNLTNDKNKLNKALKNSAVYSDKFQKDFLKKLEEYERKSDLTKSQFEEGKKLFSQSHADPFEFLKLYEAQHKRTFDRVRAIAELFTDHAVWQMGIFRSDRVLAVIMEIVRLTSWLELEGWGATDDVTVRKFELRPLLVGNPDLLTWRSPGDNTGEFCYVCGKAILPKEKMELWRFIFRSPDQRLQSASSSKRPLVCRDCVAIAFASPLKPSDQNVIIRLSPATQDNRRNGRSAAVLGEVEAFLRGLTLSQLDLAAGDYLMLTSSERVKVGNKWRCLADVIGTVPYAHLRLAELFEHQIFVDYAARIVAGISDIELAPHRLAFLSILIKALQLRLTEGSEANRPLATATRYVLADEPVLAIYELVSQPHIDQRCRQERVRIEIERSLEVWIAMIEENRAKMIAEVVAMAGLLYSFIDQTLREVRRKNDSSLDPDREASKLIEEVDEVFNFLYRFANNTTRSTVRLYRNPTNWFTYERTKVLIEQLGIDVSDRERTENSARFLEVNTNDVEAAYKHFAEGEYKDDADWRAFTYRLKLALYSRFSGQREPSR